MMATVQDIAFAFDYSAKRLVAFADELANDAVSREAMDGRKKLKTLCETRWMSRADSLTTFKNAFRDVVHALDTLQADSDTKAGQHLAAIMQFDFIISLVAAQHILSNLVDLTAILQKVDMDLIEAVRETKVVMQIFGAEWEDPLVWDAIFQEATDIAAELQVNPTVPRQHARQQHRANYAIEEPKTYWRVALYNVFLDHLLLEMETRIVENEDRYTSQLLILSRLLEAEAADVQTVYAVEAADVQTVYAAYAEDLTDSIEVFENEVRRWKSRWQLAESKPSTLISTLDKTNKDVYPNIYTVLFVLLTMPATSASCERSFSSVKRIKTWLRSTMSGERLSAIGVMHVHRDINIENIINTFASLKCRNLDFI